MNKKCLILLLALVSPTLYAQNKLTPEILWKLGRIGEHKVSPNGQQVVYTVRNFNLAENKGNTDIYLMPSSGGEAKELASTASDEQAPQWNADGSIIYFLSNEGGVNNVWCMKTDGSNKKQITASKDDISCYEISSTGNMLWVAMETKVDKTTLDLYPDLPKATGKIYDDLMYRHWTEWEDGNYSHVFIATLNNDKAGTFTDIQKGERFDTPMKPHGGGEHICWSPDGKKLAYTCKKLSGNEYAVSTNSDIYVYDIESGQTENISTTNLGYDVNPSFSPDGKKLMWLSMQTPTYEADRNRIMIYDFATQKTMEATQGFDYSVESAKWNADGVKIYFISGINATDQLWVYDSRLKSFPPIKQITNVIGDITSFSLSNNKSETQIIASMMSIAMPTELFKVETKTGETSQLSFVNKAVWDGVKKGRVEKRMVKTTDGKDMLTWVIYPPDFDPAKKYPTLLYCQGGPQSTVSQFFSYRWNFQLMAANGYIVVAPNRRGLPSFGTEWNRQISGDWGGQCMKDYLSAIDDVSKEKYVNKDKLGAVGASFGGYSVYWLAGHHEKRFKAFISHCGVFDLQSMYGTTEELWFTDFDMGGPYWQTPKPKTYVDFSPIDFVKNWDTPILVIHNEKDFRVPLGQGMEAFTAARYQNIPARFLYFPDEGHWVNKPQNSVMWQRVFFEWLDNYLK
jgi:dipeptidyl aminopeptidase/acylaminoacyl peptidase